MLKITRGLKPKDVAANDISTYIDSIGDEYVRVTTDGEDFCIAAHDYTRDGEYLFEWQLMMNLLEANGLTTFTKKQMSICVSHLDDINDKLKEIEGDAFQKYFYWTTTKCDTDPERAWIYNFDNDGDYTQLGIGYAQGKYDTRNLVRPVLNL